MNKEVEYLKEHLYEIYKYKKSMKDLTYDMDIEHLLRTCKALDYSQKEIERLNNDIKELKELLEYKNDKIERLNNIIKKVLFILEHIEDDRVGYEVCIDLLKGSDKE